MGFPDFERQVRKLAIMWLLKLLGYRRLKEVMSSIVGIEGWLDFDEVSILHVLSSAPLDERRIVEIGSYKGKSTIVLGLSEREFPGTTLVAIDPHTGSPEWIRGHGPSDTYGEFRSNIRKGGVADIVTPFQMTSEDAHKQWTGARTGILWIDGAHEYELVKLDFDLWSGLVVDGGFMAFHDSSWDGPKAVIANVMRDSRFRLLCRVNGITVFQRDGNPSAGLSRRLAVSRATIRSEMVRSWADVFSLACVAWRLRRAPARKLTSP